ncbi:MAG: DUF3307 domain-containing protein [Methylobacterium sp.]|uniref:DUF3307 domain-containing protein n=1 Tax=Methylobacterium sp. TaxID=409 RepID=UPI0025F0B3F5|nr:DUF3307 domain-containing protein [Methylobacterium sp.]MBX9934899.1 DUF3307 domain-containing protein [Methylobacterium sp.]
MTLVPISMVVALSGTMAIKHYLADFLLQTDWMARGKERERHWLLPLAAHAGCHAGMTLAVALVVEPRLWWLCLVDFSIHAAIDKAKATIGRRLALIPSQARFWWLMGFDQLLHGLTDLGLVAALLSL